MITVGQINLCIVQCWFYFFLNYNINTVQTKAPEFEILCVNISQLASGAKGHVCVYGTMYHTST